jgi:L-ascorbate metabolism protein UlaG (beta-lactamase superfamily)
MKIKWYGHAAFGIVADDGVRIIVDPYESGAFGGALTYGKITDEADIVLSSHDHDDHNYTKDIRGKFVRIRTEGVHEVKGVRIEAIPTYHDPSKGKERGGNLLFKIETEGITVVHAGDLGHVLDKEILAKVGKADILLLPVGGFYTVDAGEASRIMVDIAPFITIPMHYKTEKCDFPISPVEAFTKGKKNVVLKESSEVVVSRDSLPAEPQVVVLRYAL